MNKVFLIGRLTRDPELRYTGSNIPTATFSIAVNRNFTNQAGEREADFINVIVWRKQAENCKNYLTKGSQVAIEGRIQTRNYENKDGNKVYVTEVVCENMRMLDTRNSNSSTSYLEDYEPSDLGYQKDSSDEESINSTVDSDVDFNISEDDLPF